jgi:hypothetical protein
LDPPADCVHATESVMEVDDGTCKTHEGDRDEFFDISDDSITSTDASDVDDLDFGGLDFDSADVLDQDSPMLEDILQELEEQLGAENQSEIWRLRAYQCFL